MRLFSKCWSAVILIALMSVTSGTAGANSRSSGIAVPVMTPLTVKLEEALSIKTAQEGGGFTATFTRPVQVNGTTIIPAGSSAAGLVHRDPEYSIELNSVFVNGRSYRVTTSPIMLSRKSSIPPGTTFTFDLTLSVSIAK